MFENNISMLRLLDLSDNNLDSTAIKKIFSGISLESCVLESLKLKEIKSYGFIEEYIA